MSEAVINARMQVVEVAARPWSHWYAWDSVKFRSRRPVQLDHDAIEQACNEIGLLHVPNISHSPYHLGCTYTPDSLPALVTLDFFHDHRALSVALWHELRHCKQHQDVGYFMEPPPYALIPQWSMPEDEYWQMYWETPQEQEARETEFCGLDFPLVKEAADGYMVPLPPVGSPADQTRSAIVFVDLGDLFNDRAS